MKKEDQRVRLSKQLLRNALTTLLKEKSIHKISVREICDTAEINRTTFYKYYGSQYDLLEDIESILIDELTQKISEKGEKRMLHILKMIDKNSETYSLFLNNNTSPSFLQRVFDIPAIYDQINKITEDDADNDYNDYLYEFLTWGGYSVVKKWINKENRESPEKMAAYINRLMMQNK